MNPISSSDGDLQPGGTARPVSLFVRAAPGQLAKGGNGNTSAPKEVDINSSLQVPRKIYMHGRAGAPYKGSCGWGREMIARDDYCGNLESLFCELASKTFRKLRKGVGGKLG